MTSAIIITFCALLLIAYIFDLTSSKTKIPSVILLLLTGWVVRQVSDFIDIGLPDFTPVLPVLGTVGLILIVLEGSLELELNRSKLMLAIKSFSVAFIALMGSSFIIAYLFSYFGITGFRISLVNAIPFCVISSSIAIPSARHLVKSSREFIIYESSLSDILGVILFNFVSANETFTAQSVGHFGLEFLIMIVVSFVATISLSLLLNKIEHDVKFVPIILLVILIYTISKMYHLPALLYILIFGLFIGNLEELKRFKWIQKLRPEELDEEVQKFKPLIMEATFIVRVLFFLVFGYLIQSSELLNPDTLLGAMAIVVIVFLLRMILLAIVRMPLAPLAFIAPRGLITILLFLSIEPDLQIGIVNKSLIIQVIVFSTIVMMIGSMLGDKKKPETEEAVSTANTDEIASPDESCEPA